MILLFGMEIGFGSCKIHAKVVKSSNASQESDAWSTSLRILLALEKVDVKRVFVVSFYLFWCLQ